MVTADLQETEYLTSFERFEAKAGAAAGSWLAPVRRRAMARFAELGFPTTRQEEWRYTSVAELARTRFRRASAEAARRAASRVDPSILDGQVFGAWSSCRLVFVDGHLSEALSRRTELPRQALLGSLAEASVASRELVEPHLARHADHENHPFTALNTAFLHDGAFLFLPRGCVVEKPIHLLFVSTKAPEARVSHPRTLVIASASSQASIVESYVGLDAHRYFTNAVTEIVVNDGAHVDHYRIQREGAGAFHVGTTSVELHRDSSFRSHSIALGGLLARNDVDAVLKAEGADCTLNGLYVLAGAQHVDNHVLVDHAMPHQTSRQLYKGILDGRSRGVFDGMIIVRQDAQKTESHQENRNMILSEEALVNTKPTLRIYANDVKCCHAAATGQLDDESVFYLRTRGVDRDNARRLLVHAFAGDILRRIRIDPIRAGLDRELFGDRHAGGDEGLSPSQGA